MELAIVGNISLDTVWYGTDKRKSFFGGAGLNIALAAARCGKRPQLLSVIGHQDVSFLHGLDHFIDITRIVALSGNTCQFEINYSEQGMLRDISCRFGVGEFLDAYLRDLEFTTAHHHVCCRNPLNPHPVLSRLVNHSTPFSLDFIASSAAQQISNCKTLIEYAEWVFMNQQEFEILKTLYGVKKVKKLIVTAGSDPVVVFHYGKEILQQAFSAQAFYDVTGAGDVFTGTFLACHLVDEEPLDLAIGRSIIAAQESLRGSGVWQIW